MTRFQPRPGRHDLMKAPVYIGQIAMKNVTTGEVRILYQGSPELAALRRERHPLIWHRPAWQQVARPTRGRRV
ncbi:MAG: hypothetical protein QOG15_2059 [Solirubrobacteraceae bacterium]|jgi:hypothetical protein|nr:hypothetical protein [Solirubrobacteraceae bacterium]